MVSQAQLAPHVLVADDEVPIVELITGYLEREGYRVSTSHDGLAAVDLRRNLGDDPARARFVETDRGVGYRLRDGAR